MVLLFKSRDAQVVGENGTILLPILSIYNIRYIYKLDMAVNHYQNLC